MKHLRILFALLCAIVCCQSARSADVDIIYSRVVSADGDEWLSVEANDYAGDITIPSAATWGLGVFRVGQINRDAFKDCTNLTSVYIPNSVFFLGNSAFEGCTALKDIHMSDSVFNIHEKTFYGCESLTSIVLPKLLLSIGSWAFSGCKSLTSITIPAIVKELNCESLSNLPNITNIQVDENNKVYDSRDNCNAIIETATNTMVRGCKTTIIPTTVTSLGKYCFQGVNMTSLTIPANVTKIGHYCFPLSGSLKTLKCWAKTPPTLGLETYYSIPIIKKMYVPGASLNAYRNGTWTEFVEHIYPFVERILMPTSVKIVKGETQDFAVLPEEADLEALEWISSDENVATVDANGLCKAHNIGTTTITATANDGSGVSATCVVTVVGDKDKEWVEVTDSSIDDLTDGSIVNIYPHGKSVKIYTNNVTLTAAEAPSESSSRWTLTNAGDGYFYIQNQNGLCWAAADNTSSYKTMTCTTDLSKAAKVTLVWNPAYNGVAFKNSTTGKYLNDLYNEGTTFNWWNASEKALTDDSNSTFDLTLWQDVVTSISINEMNVGVENGDATYYTLGGTKLNNRPQQDGIYIRQKGGQREKVVIKQR